MALPVEIEAEISTVRGDAATLARHLAAGVSSPDIIAGLLGVLSDHSTRSRHLVLESRRRGRPSSSRPSDNLNARRLELAAQLRRNPNAALRKIAELLVSRGPLRLVFRARDPGYPISKTRSGLRLALIGQHVADAVNNGYPVESAIAKAQEALKISRARAYQGWAFYRAARSKERGA
jgi:hypothetical protein